MGEFEAAGFFWGRMGEDGVFVGEDAINRVPTIRGISDGVVCGGGDNLIK